MRKHVIVLTTTAAILSYGAIASAQAPGAQTPGTQQSPTTQPTPSGPMMQQQYQTRLQRRAQSGGEEDSDQDGYHGYRGGMMGGGMMGPEMIGRGMMGGGMTGQGYGHRDWHRGRDMVGPMMMLMIFSLMDADGDGKLTLQEFQAAHERIFKAMDTDHDGTVTLEEMQAFMRGH
jgi:hypothetical protein